MSASLVGSEMCIRDRQETHWRPAIAPIWEALFTDASVCYSAARRGPPVSYTHLTLPTICSV
eukprot:987335-Alexandrium_andersonii.AAC.1